jgi:hypothetical protein
MTAFEGGSAKVRTACPWSVERSQALTRRFEDTRFFASLFQGGLRYGVLLQKDEQAAPCLLHHKHAVGLD